MSKTRVDLINDIRFHLSAWPVVVRLKNAIGANDTQVELLDTMDAEFLGPKFLLEVDNEVMQVVDNPAGQTFRVLRAVRTTTRAAHAADATAYAHPAWSWTDFEIRTFVLPKAISFLKPYFWVIATSDSFTWTANEWEATFPNSIKVPDGHMPLKLQVYDVNGKYRPFYGWTPEGNKIRFKERASANWTLKCIYAKFQADLTDDTTALDNDDAVEPITLYGAHLCLNALKTNRVRFTEYSAALNDRASTVDELIRLAYDLKNQAIVTREEKGRVLPAGYASTYRGE